MPGGAAPAKGRCAARCRLWVCEPRGARPPPCAAGGGPLLLFLGCWGPGGVPARCVWVWGHGSLLSHPCRGVTLREEVPERQSCARSGVGSLSAWAHAVSLPTPITLQLLLCSVSFSSLFLNAFVLLLSWCGIGQSPFAAAPASPRNGHVSEEGQRSLTQ